MGQLPSMLEQMPIPDAGTMAAMREWGFIFGSPIKDFPVDLFINYEMPSKDSCLSDYGSFDNYKINPFDAHVKQGRSWRLVLIDASRRSPVWAFVAPDNKIYFKIIGYRRTLYEYYNTVACQPEPYQPKLN